MFNGNFESFLVQEQCAALWCNAFAKNYPMVNRCRKHCGLIYTFYGTEVYHFADQDIYARENTVVFLPKNASYTIDLIGEKSSVIYLDFELDTGEIPGPVCVTLPAKNSVEGLFLESERIWKTKKTAYRPECMALLYRVFALLAKQQESTIHPANYAKIREAVDYIHEHYTDPELKTEELARMVGINPKYFRVLFEQKFQMSPKKYILMLKTERAKELLADERYSVSEIGNLLGYSDVYHFSKAFKQATFLAPSEYRRMEQVNPHPYAKGE